MPGLCICRFQTNEPEINAYFFNIKFLSFKFIVPGDIIICSDNHGREEGDCFSPLHHRLLFPFLCLLDCRRGL